MELSTSCVCPSICTFDSEVVDSDLASDNDSSLLESKCLDCRYGGGLLFEDIFLCRLPVGLSNAGKRQTKRHRSLVWANGENGRRGIQSWSLTSLAF